MYNTLKQHKGLLVFLPLFIYWIILFILTTIPAPSLPKLLGFSDKIKHIGAYFILALLLSLSIHLQTKIKLFANNFSIVSFVIILFYGAIDELHQLLVSNRSCEFGDWFADLIGGLIGVLIIYFYIRRNVGGKSQNST